MARYPGARWRPVARYQPGGSSCQSMRRYSGGIDHTYVGGMDPDAVFAHYNTPGEAIPHFHVFRDGHIEQYVDTKFRSSACLDGNHRLITWETADGFPSLWSNGQAPKDNPAMVQAKAKLMLWLNQTHGIPLKRMKNSRRWSRGMGWHRLGIDGNFSQPPGQLFGGRVALGEHWSKSFGKTCPTERRIRQFVDETLPAAIKLSRPPAELTVLEWNAYVRNTDANVREALTRWLKEYDPDVAVVVEAAPHRRVLGDLDGYRRFQEPIAPDEGKVASEHGDVAFLVKTELEPHIKSQSVVAMLIEWLVVRSHRTHAPRRYRKLVLRKGGTTWRIRASHWPTNGFDGANRKAFLESALRSKAWLKLGLRSVSLDVGDLNERRAVIASWFGDKFKVRGGSPDLIVARRAAKIEHTELDKGGSDTHRGHVFKVTAR